ncbi:MAG TPA: FAD synthetase family protein [Candidatus Limnocylindrales bacterium]|jgi:riboflavin kinase/FMN adenylyltransferase
MIDHPEVVAGVARLPARAGRLAVAIGVFDGLHRGHRHLLRRLVRQAAAWRARAAVITFDHHPDEVIRGSAPPLLLDPEERLWRLGREGVEIVVVEHFDERLRSTPYDAFVRGIAGRIDLAGFVMTPDAAFGFERRGTPAAVAELGRSGRLRYEVAIARPLIVDGRAISSSAIRSAIADGDLAEARRLLGRSHAVVGDPDDGGLRFGMPVALPPDGSYRATVAAFPAARRRSRGLDARATVERGSIRIDRIVAGARLRVAFPGSGVSEVV